jgi:hypothetical protein
MSALIISIGPGSSIQYQYPANFQRLGQEGMIEGMGQKEKKTYRPACPRFSDKEAVTWSSVLCPPGCKEYMKEQVRT